MLKQIYKLGELEIYKKYKERQLQEHKLIDLFWQCTLTCNAKCKHCGSSAEKRKYEGELTTEEIKRLCYTLPITTVFIWNPITVIISTIF